MNISDLISGGIGSKVANNISSKTGIDSNKTKWIIAAAVPLMIAALKYNASKKEEKAKSIDHAVQTKHTGEVLDQLDTQLPAEDDEDNGKIVQNIFGKNKDSVENDLSEKSGLDKGKIAGILAMLAPIVMGYIGKQKNGSGGTGIGDIIGNILNGGKSGSSDNNSSFGGLGDLVGDFFNKDKDASSKGSILDKITGMFK